MYLVMSDRRIPHRTGVRDRLWVELLLQNAGDPRVYANGLRVQPGLLTVMIELDPYSSG
jgi:hypothetical protein